MIRPARPADADALAALQEHLDAPSPELLSSVAAVGTCLVSVSVAGVGDRDLPGGAPGAGEPVGYVLVVDGDDTYVAELVVHPAFRREGRGRALLRAALDRQDPGTRVTLAVAVDNEPARALYESAGFRPIGRQSDFYERETETADALVYAYDVPDEGAEG
ncbi:MAG: GNAT family N-acetyltransferase [Haloquadratum sp.]